LTRGRVSPPRALVLHLALINKSENQGMKQRGPSRCPKCGERVSAFAAGCAICGAELDPHRADRPTVRSRIGGRTRALPSWRRFVPTLPHR
jgi:predicted amidophosphoribosyltransferase